MYKINCLQNKFIILHEVAIVIMVDCYYGLDYNENITCQALPCDSQIAKIYDFKYLHSITVSQCEINCL